MPQRYTLISATYGKFARSACCKSPSTWLRMPLTERALAREIIAVRVHPASGLMEYGQKNWTRRSDFSLPRKVHARRTTRSGEPGLARRGGRQAPGLPAD